MANGDSSWDPIASPGLSKDDPLRDWFSQINDPGVLATFLHDPERAKEMLAMSGTPPPPISAAVPAAGYPGPTPNQPAQALPRAISGVPPQAGSALPYSDPMGGQTGTDQPLPPQAPIPRVDPVTGKLQGNLTTPFDPDRKPNYTIGWGGKPGPVGPEGPMPQPPAAPAPALAAATGGAAPTTQPNVPPSNTIAEAATEGEKTPPPKAEKEKELTPEEKKKKKIEDALQHFSDSLKGVTAPKAPPVPQVGTPGVRSPVAIQAPQIAQLLALTGAGGAPPTAAQGLARLLAGGRV